MCTDILVQQDGPILRITFNSPDRGNSVSDEMTDELIRQVRGAEKTSQLVVIRGEGDDFCVGRVPSRRNTDPLERRRQGDVIFDCYAALRDSATPVMAVVKGRALGFGCALAASCDITLAESGAQFGLPELSHNVMPANAMSAMIGRVPQKVISYLAYTTEKISAERAMMCGIVSQIADGDELERLVDRISKSILRAPKAGINAIKEYVNTAPDMPTQGAVQFARNLHTAINSAEEVRSFKAPERGRMDA